MMNRKVNQFYSKRTSMRLSSKVRPVNMPREPLKESHRIDPQERLFLESVERGDKHTVIRCLMGQNPVNVNCTNMLGHSAVQIAVDNENMELVEVLLKQEGVKIGNALLYAIQEGVYRIVEMLIDHPSITREMLGSESSKVKYYGDETCDYSPDISPVMLAAYCNQFEILQLLLLRGATIETPHQLSCSCKRCQEQVHEDSLRHSLSRINTYRALASPAWISLTSTDPILTIFKLSWELDKLALCENEFKDMYLQLTKQCKQFSCDLLDQCRSSEEVIAVLNKEIECDSDSEEDHGSADCKKLTLSRLKLGLKYEQKQFIAHPHCQQLLTSIWYEGLPGWRKHNGITKFFLCIGLIFLLPCMAVYYLIFPRSKIGQFLRSPFMKFLLHSGSFGVFLFLLTCASTDIGNVANRETFRGPPPSELEWLIVFYVTGFIWAECKQIWEEGLKAYVRQWWNWLDFIMLSLYLATFSLRIVAFVQIESGKYGLKIMQRKDWPLMDPTLISEGLFAMANVFSFARIIYLFQANQHLGPLQISLGCMLIDIAKFLFIFFLVLTSFACGLNQLYWYYNPSQQSTKSTDAFYTLGSSYVTLFWSLFSLTQLKDIQIVDGQHFTESMGELLFMAYHGMAIIVLINMLIAMMSNSFQVVENHADMVWKFARSKLWMSYFDEGSTLPPPFNLIISPKSVYYSLRALKDLLWQCFSQKNYYPERVRTHEGTLKSPNKKKLELDTGPVFMTEQSAGITVVTHDMEQARPAHNGDPYCIHPNPDELHYQEVMRRLVTRYIHQIKKQLRQDGVNEDDLLEIKQDISSLRYELREDRKCETECNRANMESLKKEILQTIRGNTTSVNLPTNMQVTESDCRAHALTQQDLDSLTREIISSLRIEIRDVAREAYLSCPPMYNTTAPCDTLLNMNSELYQTHLYTQL